MFEIMAEKPKRILYLGTNPLGCQGREDVFHCPIIEIVPREIPRYVIEDMEEYTHFIFTSKHSVSLFLNFVQDKKVLEGKVICAVGQESAKKLELLGAPFPHIAKEETQEGIIDLLCSMDLKEAYVLFPRSSLARHGIENFLMAREVRYQAFDLYDTVTKKPEQMPNLEQFEEIVFTSPSTVKAFVDLFLTLPKDKKLTSIGPITQEALQSHLMHNRGAIR